MLTYREENNPENSTVHYFDQIVDNDTVQDFASVACCLESAIYCIKKQFPFITSLIVVSDNAKCYSGGGLLGALAALSVTTGIRIERLVHTEAGEGKTELDAHFGCSWVWLQRYLNAGNDLLKPSQVVEGLRSYGGMPRSSSHLLKFNVQHCSPSTTDELGNDASDEEASFIPQSNAKGRPTTPLGDFLGKLKPKIKGNISDIRDIELCFDESGAPIQLLCRPYSGLAVTEVRN